jgi:hypothetical protein
MARSASGALVSAANIRKTLESIWRYNYKRTLAGHDCVERTYVLNDEPALMVCDYGKAERPHVPLPYYAESWTGREYLAAGAVADGSGHLFAGAERAQIEDAAQRVGPVELDVVSGVLHALRARRLYRRPSRPGPRRTRWPS